MLQIVRPIFQTPKIYHLQQALQIHSPGSRIPIQATHNVEKGRLRDFGKVLQWRSSLRFGDLQGSVAEP